MGWQTSALCWFREHNNTRSHTHSGVCWFVPPHPPHPADWCEGEVSCCSSAGSDVRGDGQPGQPGEELRLPAQVPAGGRQRRRQRGDPGQPAGRVGRVAVRLQQWWVTPVSADRDPRVMMSIVISLFVCHGCSSQPAAVCFKQPALSELCGSLAGHTFTSVCALLLFHNGCFPVTSLPHGCECHIHPRKAADAHKAGSVIVSVNELIGVGSRHRSVWPQLDVRPMSDRSVNYFYNRFCPLFNLWSVCWLLLCVNEMKDDTKSLQVSESSVVSFTLDCWETVITI